MPTDIPAYSTPDENRQVLLTSRPAGVPQAGDFTLASSPVPKPGEGEFLVRTIYLSVDPAQRGWASAEANYSAPVPLGGPMRALAVGVVVESRHPDFAEGQFLYGWFGWQDYAVATPQQVILRATQDLPLAAFGSLLGINGVTAYLGLTGLGRPRSGETLVVSTAAGSVGSFVGQIGKSLGCRCIGLTGDDRKVALCTDRYGYETAINYKTAALDAALAAAAPDGVNVYFDNTGGTILDTVLRRMTVAGRIVQCGTASVGSWNPVPAGPRNEREILTRRLVWSGFVIFDHLARYRDAADELARLWRAGTLTYDTDLVEGIDQAPGAIAALYAGENLGKKLIFVG
jgi:hypothetical protein